MKFLILIISLYIYKIIIDELFDYLIDRKLEKEYNILNKDIDYTDFLWKGKCK